MDALTDAIDRDSARFFEAVIQADPAAPVPTCPGWTAEDLLWHLTEVHSFWAEVLRRGATTDDEIETIESQKVPRPEGRDELAELFQANTAALLDELSRADDSTPAWFWLETSRTVGATRRMQAHEATFHRLDAELAAGWEPTPIAPDIAADAIAHAVEVMWAWWGTLPGFVFTPAGVVELAASDTGGRWLLAPGRWTGTGQSGKEYDEAGVRMVDDGAPAASVFGTTDELARWLWGRGPEPEGVQGDETVLGSLRAAQSAGMTWTRTLMPPGWRAGPAVRPSAVR